jgi:SAM-dependent methyltransferase
LNYDALAALYERQYADYRDDLHFYARLAERLGAERVLELGAGAGRVSVALARRGLAVTGIELSGAMLERGRVRAGREGVAVEWVAADMRSFDLGRLWPLVVAPFNAFMHLYTLDDQDQAVARVRDHLEPGGVLALDLYSPRFGPEGVLRHEGETFAEADGSRTDVFLHQRVDRAAQLAVTTYLVDTVSPDGRLSREVLELRQRYYAASSSSGCSARTASGSSFPATSRARASRTRARTSSRWPGWRVEGSAALPLAQLLEVGAQLGVVGRVVPTVVGHAQLHRVDGEHAELAHEAVGSAQEGLGAVGREDEAGAQGPEADGTAQHRQQGVLGEARRAEAGEAALEPAVTTHALEEAAA